MIHLKRLVIGFLLLCSFVAVMAVFFLAFNGIITLLQKYTFWTIAGSIIAIFSYCIGRDFLEVEK